MLARLIAWLGLGLLLAAPLMAQDVPPPLRDWQGWVLHDAPEHDCPFLANRQPGAGSYQCAWPGRLTLDAGADGGHFTLAVHVDAASWVALPGDARAWPQDVDVNRQGAVVLAHAGRPMLYLAPGDYQVRGTLPWTARPARLALPPAIGLVALSVDGKPVAHLERNDGELTLGEAAAAQRRADALALRVYRKLSDGVPATLATRLQLDVAGSARETVLGPVLPAGFVATALAGELPARLEGDGRLRVQLRPGQWTLTLQARATAPVSRLALKLPPAPWPRQEVWSYADAAALRSSRAEGQGVDAAQAGVPGAWRELPAFAMDDADGLVVRVGERGVAGGQGDQLRLERGLWLDFDGGGWSAVDQLRGTLHQRQRLDVAAPWQLQRASLDGEPLQISHGDAGRSGVELRARALDLAAGLRLPTAGGAIPDTGWQLPLDGIDATVHLPYGYRLIAAPGADRANDTWLARWSLLDLFVLALLAMLAGRLLGWRWALLVAAYLALGRHEHGAPLWTLAVVLLLALLLRALPQGRLGTALRALAAAALVLAALWSLPFAATQLQYALHPQLEGFAQSRAVQVQFVEPAAEMPAPSAKVAARMAPPPPAPPAPPTVSAMANMAASGPQGSGVSISVTGALASPPELRGYVGHGVVQAGAGTPQWNQGNNYRLGWSGPVQPGQTTRLVIAPRWLVRLLRVLLVGLLAALLARLATTLKPWRVRWAGLRATGAAAVLLLAMLPAHAQNLPSQDMLDQLKARLTEAPKCAPACADVAQARLTLGDDTLDLALEVHAGASVAVPLPQSDAGLTLSGAQADGHDAVLGRQGGAVLLRLERGVHQVVLHYRLGTAADSISLRFPLSPQRVLFSGSGWTVDGVQDGRLLGDSLSLQRQRAVAATPGQAAPVQDFPPYVRLTRRLLLGVDWQVENTVERIAPASGGFSLELPLLTGEHPLGDGVPVRDGRIELAFSAGMRELRWSSRLDHADTLALVAPPLHDRVEVWAVDAAPWWHVRARGVPAVADDDGLRFQPLPGETLQLAFSRPAPVDGGSLAFDRVQLNAVVGERATDATLMLDARSTRGGEHAITLPAGAELLDATRDGGTLNLTVRQGKLGLPLLPGPHGYQLHLRMPQGIAARASLPAFALAAPAANLGSELDLPQDRWVLWAWGPATGPVVLYWSQLAVLLLVAWLLARHAPTPLRLRHWLLLGLGFSAFDWGAFALVVGWLILLGLRARLAEPAGWDRWRFNLVQLGLAVLTVFALLVLVGAVPRGLLGQPDMHVAGNDSTAWALHWFADRSSGSLPAAGVLSVSLWWYKLAMLAWALWLAYELVGWLRWAFEAWSRGGYWRRAEPRPGVDRTASVPPPPLPGEPHA